MSPRPFDGAETERPPQPPPRFVRQLLWFVGLWLAGLAVVGSLAYAIRTILL